MVHVDTPKGCAPLFENWRCLYEGAETKVRVGWGISEFSVKVGVHHGSVHLLFTLVKNNVTENAKLDETNCLCGRLVPIGENYGRVEREL